ncbi:MAG TPA: MarR family transcriptional regulator [Gaiellaceae bacterium]|nr:MarR family transcriptional regulator [Gaiellaceae bacterium]
MPRPRKHAPPVDALVGTAALTARWVERLLAAHDPALTVGQYLALRSIDRESLTAAELARRAGVSGPAVSQLVASLEGAGWIERSPLSEDRRQQALSLTGAGEVVLTSASVLLRERIGPLLAELPPPEIDALDRLLGLLESTLAGTPPPRRPHPPPPPHHPEAHPPPPR